MKKLIINNLSASYKKKGNKNNEIFKDFSIEVDEGELVVLLGPSGCGKSTLLTIISGLKTPTKGEISFGDDTFFSSSLGIDLPSELRNVGFVFQSYALWPHMTIYQNMALPLKVRKYNKKDVETKVDELLDMVNMREYKDRYPKELSGGERQRIALVRSLIYEPSLLLLDEPLANLDANLKTSLIREIKDIQRKFNIPAIYVTHDQSEAFEIADKIVVMNEGKIMQQGRPMDIYTNPSNLFVAEFIGQNNVFKMKDCNNEGILHCCQKNIVAIRPEDIYIHQKGEYEGVVKNVLYKGNYTEYMVRTKENKLKISSTKNEGHQVGDIIHFDINRYHSFDD